MDNLTDSLAETFEEAGYEVGETSTNRSRVRVVVLDPEASAEHLRELTYSTVEEADVLGFDVTTESGETQQVRSVVSFRYRG